MRLRLLRSDGHGAAAVLESGGGSCCLEFPLVDHRILLAVLTYIFSHSQSLFAIPIVIMGLASLAGGTWFLVNWSTKRVKKAWPSIGVEL